MQADSEISTIYGLDGNDVIRGGEQDDYLYGGDGDDVLTSYMGSDTLHGGNGNDTLIYGGNSNSYTAFWGDQGDDTYIVDKNLLTNSSYIHILDNANENNVLLLKSVNVADIILTNESSGYKIGFLDSSSSIHINENSISSIRFDDGTIWDRQTIQNKVANTSATAQALFADDSLLNILDQSADQVPTSTNTIVPMSFDIQSLLSPQNHTVDQIEVNTPQDSIILNESALAKASTVDILIQNNFIHPIDELIKQTTVLY
ncbi:calcium-binding protein [Acinetobacter gerneri]|uniref:calcium-binding protein n=1 Tax=Acinetobacter gerneri TaxID=202952 RepID=UPI003A85671B